MAHHEAGAYLIVQGEVDISSADRLRDHLDTVFGEGCHRIVVDLENVSFLDSTGLGVLVGALKRARAADGELVLLCTQRSILSILETTGLRRVFTVHDSLEGSMRQLGAGTGQGQVATPEWRVRTAEMGPVTVETGAIGDGWLIRLRGALDVGTVPAAERDIRRAVEPHQRGCVVLDLGQLEYCDSAGIALIFVLQREWARRRTDLRLVVPVASPLRRLLEIVGVPGALAVFDSATVALAGEGTPVLAEGDTGGNR